ncbi:MAG: RtcB family protein [Pseudomonadota bacterium]
MLTGKDLIDAKAQPGPWFAKALDQANAAIADGMDPAAALNLALTFAPPPALQLRGAGDIAFFENIEANTEFERDNVSAVRRTMATLMRTPVIEAGAVMPDACPAGPQGTIPVGGVVASKAIHPGMHSADICCSMALTNYGRVDPAKLMQAVAAITHFGPGERDTALAMPHDLQADIEDQALLKPHAPVAAKHFGTQGDGNHFAYVGTLASSGDTVLVTHHGSRGLGARLYKTGMALAEKHRKAVSPETLKANAWIDPNTAEGEAYWRALQTVRAWTKANHFVLHDCVREQLGAQIEDRFWNEHNFVFQKSDGLFYHAKGATPAFDGWADDATDLTLIPLNMREPILITRGLNANHGLGFSPHGAGRNMSRTAHKKLLGDVPAEIVFARETEGLDARFFCGRIDVSELPSAYKNAATVRAQIDQFGLAEVVDEVIPHGSIMAGDWEFDAPWRKKRRAQANASTTDEPSA